MKPMPSVSQVTELLPFGLLDSPVNSPTSSIHELEDEDCGPNVANENEEPKARRQKLDSSQFNVVVLRWAPNALK